MFFIRSECVLPTIDAPPVVLIRPRCGGQIVCGKNSPISVCMCACWEGDISSQRCQFTANWFAIKTKLESTASVTGTQPQTPFPFSKKEKWQDSTVYSLPNYCFHNAMSYDIISTSQIILQLIPIGSKKASLQSWEILMFNFFFPFFCFVLCSRPCRSDVLQPDLLMMKPPTGIHPQRSYTNGYSGSILSLLLTHSPKMAFSPCSKPETCCG